MKELIDSPFIVKNGVMYRGTIGKKFWNDLCSLHPSSIHRIKILPLESLYKTEYSWYIFIVKIVKKRWGPYDDFLLENATNH